MKSNRRKKIGKLSRKRISSRVDRKELLPFWPRIRSELLKKWEIRDQLDSNFDWSQVDIVQINIPRIVSAIVSEEEIVCRTSQLDLNVVIPRSRKIRGNLI